MKRPGRRVGFLAALISLGAAALGASSPVAAQVTSDQGAEREWNWDWGVEAKVHYRDSDSNRFRSPFGFTPPMLPLGERVGFLETVDAGEHFEASALTLLLDANRGKGFGARLKVDIIDLYDRNPTSEDHKVDVDEAWLRFGQETQPARLAASSGIYVKLGKFAHFERQDDRHLESYGLVSTAFNRFEDLGVELGVDLGRHFYMKASATAGNPLFIRDPNALAGDNGIPELLQDNPDPDLKSGVVILYDAESDDIDFDQLELGAGLGVRFENAPETVGADLLVWSYRRDLAEELEIDGSFYGGDLDLLRGPLNSTPLDITNDEKSETGANLWLYLGGFSFFGQIVDQEVAGLDRSGFEAEVSWSFDLPLKWALAGRQVFTFIAPALRYSKLDPDITGGAEHPAVSIRWEWEKLDLGVRLGLYSGLDLTLEYSDNSFILGTGAERDNNELLTTLRWRL